MYILNIIKREGWYEDEQPLELVNIGVYKNKAINRYERCVADIKDDLIFEGCRIEDLLTFTEETPAELKTTIKWHSCGNWKRVEVRLSEVDDFTDDDID